MFFLEVLQFSEQLSSEQSVSYRSPFLQEKVDPPPVETSTPHSLEEPTMRYKNEESLQLDPI